MLPLRKGDGPDNGRGQDVRALQYLLNHTFGCQLDADGTYGKATSNAVETHIAAGVGSGDYVDGAMWGRLIFAAGARDGKVPAAGANHPGGNPRHT